MLRFFLGVLCLSFCYGCQRESDRDEADAEKQPNIIIFYVDDLGYADIGCYGAKGVDTPNIDRMAKNGVRFTDAHSPAATCTPSRYAMLTGRYAFRNNAAILPGDAPLLIDTSQVTMPKMLQQAGYSTAAIGKWHLGLGYGEINWNEKITPGANEIGFGYSFLIPATGDRVPTVFVEDGQVVSLDPNDPLKVSYDQPIAGSTPLGTEHPELLKQKADLQHSNTIVNGISRIGYTSGGEKAQWVDEDFPYVLNEKSRQFINEHSSRPFFLYYSFHDIHVPRVPHKNFVGKSTMGPRGDAIAQVDWVVGDILQELEEQGILEETLIIFTSDNGPVLNDGYFDHAVELVGDHDPSGGFRGGKYSAYEAGTRVPTITYWPGHINAGKSDALLTQVDLLASLAALVGQPIDTLAMDSKNYLQTWMGQSEAGRQTIIEEAFTLALRQNNWKYIEEHSGTIPAWMSNKDIESGLMSSAQLYDLSRDPGEKLNLADSMQAKASELRKALQQIKKGK